MVEIARLRRRPDRRAGGPGNLDRIRERTLWTSPGAFPCPTRQLSRGLMQTIFSRTRSSAAPSSITSRSTLIPAVGPFLRPVRHIVLTPRGDRHPAARRLGLVAMPRRRHIHLRPTADAGRPGPVPGFAGAGRLSWPHDLTRRGVACPLRPRDPRLHARRPLPDGPGVKLAIAAGARPAWPWSSFGLQHHLLHALRRPHHPARRSFLPAHPLLDARDAEHGQPPRRRRRAGRRRGGDRRRASWRPRPSARPDDENGSSSRRPWPALALGFLIFNFHPAKIFMGDSGSHFLGAALGLLSIIGVAKVAVGFALAVP